MSDDFIKDREIIPYLILQNDITLSVGIFKKPIDKLLFIVLKTFAGQEGNAFPSLNTLCRICSVSKRDTIIESLDRLVEIGAIEILKRQKENGANNSNLYCLNPFNSFRGESNDNKSGVVQKTDKGSPKNGQGVVQKTDKDSPKNGHKKYSFKSNQFKKNNTTTTYNQNSSDDSNILKPLQSTIVVKLPREEAIKYALEYAKSNIKHIEAFNKIESRINKFLKATTKESIENYVFRLIAEHDNPLKTKKNSHRKEILPEWMIENNNDSNNEYKESSTTTQNLKDRLNAYLNSK